MPIVVDPGFAWPPEVDPVVSPDGRITAIVDPAHAGVLLRADYSDQPGRPDDVAEAANLIPNPSLESGLAGWRARSTHQATVALSTFGPAIAVGSQAMYIQANSTAGNDCVAVSDPIPVNANSTYTVAASVRKSSGTGAISFRMYWYDGSGNRISTDNAGVYRHNPSSSQNHLVNTRVSGQYASPAGAVSAEVGVWLTSTTSDVPPAGSTVHIDAVSFVESSTDAPYFDGDTESGPTDNDPHYRWTDAPHASPSEKYLPAIPMNQSVAKVRFERQDGTVVRSGNPAWAPGGYAHAYDHEATLGGGTLWRAVPIHFDGSEGTPSEYVGAVIPALSDGWAWLKPVADPDKAMLLKVEPPDLSYDGRVDTTSIAGAPRPAATWDVLEGFTTQLRSLVREKDVEEQLKALLDEGPVLAQFPACAGLPDFYFIRGKLDLEHVHWDGWPWRRYQWEVVQIDRPDTTDSPLRIPGLSYDTVARDWTTYDQLRSTVESYNKLLEP